MTLLKRSRLAAGISGINNQFHLSVDLLVKRNEVLPLLLFLARPNHSISGTTSGRYWMGSVILLTDICSKAVKRIEMLEMDFMIKYNIISISKPHWGKFRFKKKNSLNSVVSLRANTY